MNKLKPNRIKYKKLSTMRKNPSKYIPHHLLYCYGVVGGREGYSICPFCTTYGMLNSYERKVVDKDIENGDSIIEEYSAKCSLTGKWVFDLCKHCGINEDFVLDKNGEEIW